MKKENISESSKAKKIFTVVSLIIVLILVAFITIFVCKWLNSFSKEGFREYINSFGAGGWLVLLSLQILQVFIALIPGELLESAAGYAFGPWIGTLICYVGVAIGSAVIFYITRRFGTKAVEIFVSRDKINELRFINTAKKRNFLVFFVFFIPGTPKDLLTYFVGLTEIKFISFLSISLVARIPSVLSSTFGGHLIGEGDYLGAIVVYGATALVSIAGLLFYNCFIKKRNKQEEIKDSETSV